MSNFKIGGSKLSRFVNGKGFYIALAFCLVAIGTAAYVAVNNTTGIKNSIKSQGSSASSIPNWDSGADSTSAQTNNTVSNVPDTRSSTASKTQSSSSAASASSSASSTAKIVFAMPVRGNVITAFSGDKPVYDKTMDDWRVHQGVDLAAAEGTPVKACASGKVVDVRIDDLLGQEVIIDHGNGLRSIYSNLTNKVVVKKGQQIEVGDTIGAVGETTLSETSLASHLHFGMTKNGVYTDPLAILGGDKS